MHVYTFNYNLIVNISVHVPASQFRKSYMHVHVAKANKICACRAGFNGHAQNVVHASCVDYSVILESLKLKSEAGQRASYK